MKKVLLVEDDPLLIDIYTTKLQQAEFEVSVAEDGEKAIHRAEEQKPDCMILDIVLPRKDGWEVLASIKKNPELEHTKMIILSNLGQREDVEKGKRLGADLYLIKAHYTPSQVVEEIKQLFV